MSPISRLLQHKALRLVPFIVLLALALPKTSMAQGYEISGESSLSGTFTLTLYDRDGMQLQSGETKCGKSS